MLYNSNALKKRGDENMKIYGNNVSEYVPSFPLFIAKDDKERYINYKYNNAKPSDKYEKDAMEIISILERLGFSLDEVGTYLYKELIVSIYQEIKSDEEITESREEMLNRLIKKLVYNILEITKDQYEEFVKESIDSIDGNDIDIELSDKIFKDSIYDYGNNAFEIAYQYKEIKKIEKEKKTKKGLILSKVFKFR